MGEGSGESETEEECDEDVELDVEDENTMQDETPAAEEEAKCWIIAHRRDDPTGEVATQNPTGEAAQQNPACEVEAQQNPADEVAVQNPTGEVAAKNPAGEIAAQNPAGEVAAQNPAGEVAAQQNPTHESRCAGLASVDPQKPIAPRLLWNIMQLHTSLLGVIVLDPAYEFALCH